MMFGLQGARKLQKKEYPLIFFTSSKAMEPKQAYFRQ